MVYIPPKGAPKKAVKTLKKVTRAINLKNYPKAIKLAESALLLYPDYNDAWAILGMLYRNARNYEKSNYAYIRALETFEQFAVVVRYHPGKVITNLVPIWTNLGRNYLEGTKEIAYAYFCLNKAYELNADEQVKRIISQCLITNPNLKPEQPNELNNAISKLSNVEAWQKKIDNQVIEFIEPYEKVPFETIAQKFFPAPVSYADYRRSVPSMQKAMRQGFRPESLFFKSSEIIGNGLQAINIILKRLIKQNKISGIIRPMGGQSYFINQREVSPPISNINIDRSIKINARDISSGNVSINFAGKFCPKCGKTIEKDWESCPYCSISLSDKIREKSYCLFCGKKVETDWKSCPYCSNNLE